MPDDTMRKRRGKSGTSVSAPPSHFFCVCPEQPTDETIYFFLPLVLADLRRCPCPTERPMKIEIVVDPSKPAAATSLASRVAPAAAAATPANESAPRFAFHGFSHHPLLNYAPVLPGPVVGLDVAVVVVAARAPSALRRLQRISMLRWR